ncbi:MAG: SDR family oxidoreductase [Halodesulfurarchaeum sp.]
MTAPFDVFSGTRINYRTVEELDMERTVLITGCSSGIGRATARAFLDADWTVFATARDVETIEDLQAEGCRTAELDVTDPQQIRDAVDRVISETGRVDCLVNNAGYAQLGTLEDLPPRDLHRQFDVNVYGPHRLVRAVLPHMREAERGTIVNVSSVLGRLSIPGAGAYAGSKAALESMSDALRSEVETFGVEVVVVEPGPVDTSFEERSDKEMTPIQESDAYAGLYDAYEDARMVSWMGKVEPDVVADVILEAGTSTNPDSRYTVGPVARYAVLARYIPDRWRDAVFRAVRWLA